MKNNFSTTLNEEMIRFDIAIIGGGASGILLCARSDSSRL